MALAERMLEQNAGRPKDLTDFDRRLGFAYLRLRRTSPDESVWTPSWWLNFTCLVSALLLAAIAYAAIFWREDSALDAFAELAIWQQAFLAFFCLVGATVFLMLALGAVNRCRLVVDRRRMELRFSYGLWFWRRCAIPLDQIRIVKSWLLDTPSIDEPSIGTRAVFIELQDGQLVLVAVSPDWRKASLYREIQHAAEAAHTLGQPALLPA